MISKILVVICVLVAVTSAVPSAGWPAATGWGAGGGWPAIAGGGAPVVGANPWLPPWIASAPWMPQWSPCTAVGSTCLDCNTKLVCTKIGGMQRACADPTLPYCNLGACSATPTAECAPATDAAVAA